MKKKRKTHAAAFLAGAIVAVGAVVCARVISRIFSGDSIPSQVRATKEKPVGEMSMGELKKELKAAVDREDYPRAILLRDEINSRTKKNA